jgi:hypothetical protein
MTDEKKKEIPWPVIITAVLMVAVTAFVLYLMVSFQWFQNIYCEHEVTLGQCANTVIIRNERGNLTTYYDQCPVSLQRYEIPWYCSQY